MKRMDIPIWLIVIAIIALIAALALLWIDRIEVPRRTSERYINELKAETDLLSKVKPVVAGSAVMLPIVEDGSLTWRRENVSGNNNGQSDATQAVDMDAIKLHDDCVELVKATLDNPPSEKYKRKDNQLMTADECQERGVLGGDRTRRQSAVKYLVSYYKVRSENDQGNKNGVFYDGGELKNLMTDLAIHGKVPYPGQKWNGDGKA